MNKEYPEEFLTYLNMLHTLSFSENAGKTQSMIQRMVSLINYRYIRMGEIVTVNEELLHIKMLMDIFTARFGSKLDYTQNVLKECLNCYLPHYTLVSFVENALHYGLEPKDGEWKLQLNIETSDNELLIQISDNGVGFDVNSVLSSKNAYLSRYGTINHVLSSIHLYFEGNEKVKITSFPNKGTKIMLVFPL